MRLSAILISTFLLIGFSFTLPTAHGQSGDEVTTQEIRDMVNTNRVPVRRTTETTGTPYLFENFNDGSIKLSNGLTTAVLPLRFNAHEQKLEFQEGQSAFIMDSNTIKEFEMHVENSTHTFKKGYDARGLSEDEFVRLIIDDEVKFIAKHTVSFQQGVASYGSATKKDKYLPNVTYYIKVGDEKPNRLRSLSKRRVMRLIDSHKSEVGEFADKSNTDFSDPSDVEKLLLYYNSLLTEAP